MNAREDARWVVDTIAEQRDEIKRLEQQWMVLKDRYSELAKAIGSPTDAWFGDPLERHEEVLERAKSLAAKATMTPLQRRMQSGGR